MSKDLYKILELDKTATEDDIKKCYKKLALKYHPDKQIGKTEEEKKESEEKFKEITEAYSILSDPEKRQQYDTFGTIGDIPNFNPNDIINEMFRNMGGFNPFGGSQHTQQVIKGDNIRITIHCTLEDVYNGISKTIKYKRMVKCDDCDGYGSTDKELTVCDNCGGSGRIREVQQQGWMTQIYESVCPDCNGLGKKVKNPCTHCGGKGLVEKEETFEFKIPKHVQHGNSMRVPNYGNDAPNNLGLCGDLIITFNIKQHNIFGVDDNTNNLYCKTNVNIIDCILGTEKEINCIDGTKTTIKIDRFTKENTKIIVKGKGMPKINGGFGDMVVYIQTTYPNKLNSDEIKLLEELKKQKHFK
jgi:molecular chaperone DnaJ